MTFAPLLNLTIVAGAPIDLGRGPYGQRLISHAGGGSFSGPRLNGNIMPGGGDWILADSHDVWHMDVRLLLKTHDEAHIYLQYHGVLVMTARIASALNEGHSAEFGDTYFMTQPRFETSDARYEWLNQIVAIGEGRLLPGAVEYRIFELFHN